MLDNMPRSEACRRHWQPKGQVWANLPGEGWPGLGAAKRGLSPETPRGSSGAWPGSAKSQFAARSWPDKSRGFWLLHGV